MVRDTPHVRPWVGRFPGIAGDLMVSTGQIRFRDRRVRTSSQRFGSGFTRRSWTPSPALAGTLQQGEIGQLVIVSDDISWCQALLSWLSRFGEMSYFTGSDPLGHFATLIGARRLVLTNSTFSYWGAYLSAAHHRLIWGPASMPATSTRDAPIGSTRGGASSRTSPAGGIPDRKRDVPSPIA